MDDMLGAAEAAAALGVAAETLRYWDRVEQILTSHPDGLSPRAWHVSTRPTR
ncbi:hypothetical protein [Arthrobacter sp. Soil736]|uniref:hypothetical protein n=1 Tax=Arthrobacter sp. Soil736 TaxID=1736395 RepID=UPI000A4BED3E|nr:hypothetical protein [Arthrobacter sp. Soil736]